MASACPASGATTLPGSSATDCASSIAADTSLTPKPACSVAIPVTSLSHVGTLFVPGDGGPTSIGGRPLQSVAASVAWPVTDSAYAAGTAAVIDTVQAATTARSVR